MFFKAKINPMFDSVRPQVDALLEDILQKTKANAEKEISNIEFAFQKMKKWFNGDYASSDDVQKYNSIRDKISDAKGNFKTRSYFGYDDTLRIMSEADGMVDEIQASIRANLDSAKIGLESCNLELNKIPAKLDKIGTGKQIEVVKKFLLFIGSVVLFRIALWVMEKIPESGKGFFYALGMVTVMLLTIIELIIGIPVAIILFILLLRSFGNLFISGDPTKKLQTRQKELNERINTLKRRIAAAKGSLL